jgi:hypothetical protein
LIGEGREVDGLGGGIEWKESSRNNEGIVPVAGGSGGVRLFVDLTTKLMLGEARGEMGLDGE